jgi:hypothetical protein
MAPDDDKAKEADVPVAIAVSVVDTLPFNGKVPFTDLTDDVTEYPMAAVSALTVIPGPAVIVVKLTTEASPSTYVNSN